MSVKNKYSGAACATLIALCLGVPALAAGLAKNRNTALVLYDRNGSERYESRTDWDDWGGSTFTTSSAPITGSPIAIEIIRKALLENGFKVVNEKQLASIHKAKAARLALEGDIEAIKKLSGQYGIGQYVTGTVTVQRGARNEFGLYTGGAAITLNAYSSNGKYIMSETATSKEAGYSEDEAAVKSVQSAAQQIADALTGGGTQQAGADGCRVVVSGLRSFRAVQNVVNACRSVYGVTAAEAEDYKDGSSTVAVVGTFSMSELKIALTDKLPNSRISKTGARTIYLDVY